MMFGTFDALKLGIAAAIGGIVAWSIAYPLAHHLGEKAGYEQAQQEARDRALELIQKRSEDNAEISDMDLAGLCRELGGRWVSGNCVD